MSRLGKYVTLEFQTTAYKDYEITQLLTNAYVLYLGGFDLKEVHNQTWFVIVTKFNEHLIIYQLASSSREYTVRQIV